MSSTSFGSPSAIHGAHSNAASPATPAAHVVGAASSPSQTHHHHHNHQQQQHHPSLTRNDRDGGSHNNPLSPTLQRPQNIVHGSPSSYQPHQQHHQHQQHQSPRSASYYQRQPIPPQAEIIELTDSDTDTNSRSKKSAAPPPAKTIRLQPPFDPIPRSTGSATKSSSATTTTTATTNAAANPNTTTTAHRASATPSIASIINVDNHCPIKKPRSSNPSPTSSVFNETTSNNDLPVLGANSRKADRQHSPKSKPATATNSSAPSPKPPSRPAAPPIGSGGGLLGGVLPMGMGVGVAGGGVGLGGISNGHPDSDFQVPNIYIEVPLNGEQNKYINFTKLAEERYGWAALNPRLARAKMHMDSGDEMMVDGSESESNVELGGAGEAAADDPKKRKKRRYQDVYDKEDPFIDDSEMLWEQQAAASKDGFFVYSGPLVPEGEKPQIERADGTVRRGRGRGRGARGGATSTRGTGTTARKTRITKKEKEKLEKEKEERERYALSAAQAKLPPR